MFKAMRADESTVFTDEQRVQLSEVVSERITTTQMQDVVGERMHGSKKGANACVLVRVLHGAGVDAYVRPDDPHPAEEQGHA